MLYGGLVLIVLALIWPAPEKHVTDPKTLLDRVTPVYQFSELHEIRIRASKEQVWEALHQVTAGEIHLFRTLTWIRRFGRKSSESRHQKLHKGDFVMAKKLSGDTGNSRESSRTIRFRASLERCDSRSGNRSKLRRIPRDLRSFLRR